MPVLRTLTAAAMAALVAALVSTGCSGEGGSEEAVPDTAAGRGEVVRDSPPTGDSIVVLPETTLPMPDTSR